MIDNTNPTNPINVHAIIGNATVGKGTVVRHLSGCRMRSNDWHLSVAGISHVFAVRLSSLQEGQQAISPRDFIAEIRALQYPVQNVLIPLRLQSRANFPSYDVYLQDFQNAGWKISSLAYLSQPTVILNFSTANNYHLPNPHAHVWVNTPSNLLSDNIRHAWGW